MKAAVFDAFGGPISIREVTSLVPRQGAALIDVQACGICRSDWHAWMGHDSEVQLPHVPGHELAGIVSAVGEGTQRWRVGDRVTVPFCCGCGTCLECLTANSHICDHYTQPGFTHWGGFAEQVEIQHADFNLVRLPESIDWITAASLGCRFVTSFRGLVMQARLQAGEWLAVHGCGGVGLSAIMIAKAIGAQIIGIDIQPKRLQLATTLGADEVIDGSRCDVPSRILEITGRGANVSIDALGDHRTCWNSIQCLAKRGRHIQIGLMLGDHSNPPIPMASVIAKELEIYGSHGIQPFEYSRIFEMIARDKLNPQVLVSDTVTLEQATELLMRFGEFPNTGISVIDCRN
jgi:alcohol dehydrogenase